MCGILWSGFDVGSGGIQTSLLTYLIGGRYFSTTLPRARLLYAIWIDEEFLLSASIANRVIRRACAERGISRPARLASCARAAASYQRPPLSSQKLSAMATALQCVPDRDECIRNRTPCFRLPGSRIKGSASCTRWQPRWITTFAAGIFCLSRPCSRFEDLAAQLMTQGLFMRVSGFLQLTALFVVIALVFVTPAIRCHDPPPACFAIRIPDPGPAVVLVYRTAAPTERRSGPRLHTSGEHRFAEPVCGGLGSGPDVGFVILPEHTANYSSA